MTTAAETIRLAALNHAVTLVQAQIPQMHLNAQRDEMLRLARQFEEYLRGDRALERKRTAPVPCRCRPEGG